MDFPRGSEVKKRKHTHTHTHTHTCSAGAAEDMDSIRGLGRSPGGGHGNPLQYSYLENPMDRGAWQAVVHRVTKR